MTNKQLYFVNRSVLFLAIAYAINGYTLPSLACSIISSFLTCEFIGYEKIKNSVIKMLFIGIMLSGLIRMVGLHTTLPMLEVSAYASALFAVSVMFVLIGISIVLPLSSLQFGYTMVFITIVFMPILFSYGITLLFTKVYANTLDKKATLR